MTREAAERRGREGVVAKSWSSHRGVASISCTRENPQPFQREPPHIQAPLGAAGLPLLFIFLIVRWDPFQPSTLVACPFSMACFSRPSIGLGCSLSKVLDTLEGSFVGTVSMAVGAAVRCVFCGAVVGKLCFRTCMWSSVHSMHHMCPVRRETPGVSSHWATT